MLPGAKRRGLLQSFIGWALLVSAAMCWAESSDDAGFTNAVVLSIANQVEFRRSGSKDWDPAYVQPTNLVLKSGDRLRTGKNSRALLRLSNLTDFPVGELTQLEIPAGQTPRRTVRLLQGILYFFHRDKPGEFQVDTPTVSAVVRGTEFTVEVADNGDSKFQVLDGELGMTNALGDLTLRRGEEGVAAGGAPPRKTAVIMASTANVVQWCLYYPGILNLDELAWQEDVQTVLGESLAAYRAGDLPGALTKYPAGREPASPEEKIYRAALLLVVGNINEALQLLPDSETGGNTKELANAIRTLVAAVKFESVPTRAFNTNSATAWLVQSYLEQSQFQLQPALDAARRATDLAPDFAFAWARVSELEFGFGRIRQAKTALDRSLSLAPRNAQALTLQGFLLAALHREVDALRSFDEAILADGALANSWLGRGLVRIHRGDIPDGRADLLVAATLEPQRSLLRSYLAKALADSGDIARATKELALAKELDANDPTAWLYSALLKREQHEFNDAIRELEHSTALNDNRRVYRSRLLLDQDRSTRSTSLAAIYRDNGMTEVSAREAAVAVADSYANYDAHLFLANSLDALRDPTRFNLRYETAWFNELLLANLLSPAGAGTFAQSISQQEYSQFFNVRKLGLTTTTDARSDGQYRELVSQFGNFGSFSYSLDLDYQHNDGVRPNNELDRIEWYSQFKFQLSPADMLFLLTKYQDYHSGDNFQYYDWHTSVRTNLTYDESQHPILAAGYHHQWSPGMETLFLGARLSSDQQVSDKASAVYFFVPSDLNYPTNLLVGFPFDVNYRNRLEIYSAELSQVLQVARQTLVLGGRYQAGRFRTEEELTASPPGAQDTFGPSPDIDEDFERFAGYAYYSVEIVEHLQLTGGVSYDQVTFPSNFRGALLSSGQTTRSELSPKAALIWRPITEATLRGAYAQSLGGVSFDQSFRLEPVQLAGLNQTFRTIIPESVVGSVSAPTFETFGGALDLKFKTGTYFGFQGQVLQSSVDQTVGNYTFQEFPPLPASSTRQLLDYKETSLLATFNQLAGRDWAFGVRYQFTHSRLQQAFPDLPTPLEIAGDADTTAALHQVTPYLLFNHPSGFFARAEASWYSQRNSGYNPSLPGDEFGQVNLFAGWRLRRQRGDLTLGILNLAGRDYHLNPLNFYAELPRERVWSGQLRLRF